MVIAAGKFKAQCLKLMDRVYETHEEILISKHGKTVAKLVPVEPTPYKNAFGFLADSIKEEGDIINSTGEKWNAEE
jgi:prevent-host-death family protein